MAARGDHITVGATRIELDAPAGERAVATSVRLPAALHRAATAAVEAGHAGSLTELVVTGLETTLDDLATRSASGAVANEAAAALDEIYAAHPRARPDLAEIAEAAALLTGHPAADRPDLIARAVADLGDDAFLDDLLAWVRGALATEPAATSRRGT